MGTLKLTTWNIEHFGRLISESPQAVRLPKAYRFEGNEVYIKKVPGGVLLMDKNEPIWDLWEKNLMKYDEQFITDRNQPVIHQKRENFENWIEQ